MDPVWVVHAWSLLRFQPVTLTDQPLVDWLFFYSKKGVKFLLEQFEPPTELRLAAMGKATGEALTTAGFPPDFVGSGQPNEVAEAFKPLAQGQRVGFVQARQSRQSVQLILKNVVQSTNWVVYDNQPEEAKARTVPTTDYLLLTSPLNVIALLGQKDRFVKSRFIVIGSTTAQSLRRTGIVNFRQAEAPSEAALLQCLLRWEKESPINES